MEEFQAQYELWMPHVHRDRVRKFMCHKQVEYVSSPEQIANPTVAISKADYATAVEVQRIFSATCAFPERFNVFCLVSAKRPEAVVNFRRRKAWGHRRIPSSRRGDFVSSAPASSSSTEADVPALSPLSPSQTKAVSPLEANTLSPISANHITLDAPTGGVTVTTLARGALGGGLRKRSLAAFTASADSAGAHPVAKRSRQSGAPRYPSPDSDPVTVAAADYGGHGRGSRRRRRTDKGKPADVTTERVGTADIDDEVLLELVTDSDASDSDDETPTTTRRRGKLPPQPNVTGVAGLKWQTDSFAACFPSSIKPSAANYNLMRKDYEHYLKYGTSLHGELFCDGVRVPRKDGIPHTEPLPTGPIPRSVGGMDSDGPV